MTRPSALRLARAPLVAFSGMGVLWGAYAALVPDTMAMLGVSDAAFGSLLLATPIAAVMAMFAAPRLAPRFGRHVLPAAIAMMALAFMLPGWVALPAGFAAAMVAVGATNGFLDVTMTARVSAIETREGVHLMNLNHAAYSLAYAFSAVATGLLREAGASPGAVLTLAALVLLLFVPLAVEGGSDVNGFERRRARGQGLGQVPFWGGLIVLIAFLSENAAENWSALHIERSLGGSPAAGSFGPAVLALTMGLGRIAGQAMIARTDERRLLTAGSVVCALGLCLAALAVTPAMAYAGLIVMGLGGSVLAPTAFSAIGRLAPEPVRAHVLARATALGYMGYFFGPPALGFLSEVFTLRVAFLCVALVVLAVVGLYPLMLRAAGGQGPGRPEIR
ncbi:MAG: hypothetical protein RLZZ528_601 [Pseudomonadota bacterium]